MAATIEAPTTDLTRTERTEKIISFVPLGERDEIHLTLARTKQFLCVPTKSGAMPTDEQVFKYMMLCKAQSLNPWVNDAYLVGYDGKDGPQFSLITAHQSFLKRAEASPEFEGIESGVVVSLKGVITERQGDLMMDNEVLVGAWARVHRSDRKIPSYDALNLKTFNTGRSRWAADPAGMIVKCAEASALRKAFPSTLAAMYCKEEMDRERESRQPEPLTLATVTAPRIAEQPPFDAGTTDDRRPTNNRADLQAAQAAKAAETAAANEAAKAAAKTEPAKPAAKATEQAKPAEPAKGGKREPVSPELYMRRIEAATTEGQLDGILSDLDYIQNNGPLSFDECQQLGEMAQNRKKELT
jgi:phage recombination protein Bet